jgi:hypothetical protein
MAAAAKALHRKLSVGEPASERLGVAGGVMRRRNGGSWRSASAWRSVAAAESINNQWRQWRHQRKYQIESYNGAKAKASAAKGVASAKMRKSVTSKISTRMQWRNANNQRNESVAGNNGGISVSEININGVWRSNDNGVIIIEVMRNRRHGVAIMAKKINEMAK